MSWSNPNKQTNKQTNKQRLTHEVQLKPTTHQLSTYTTGLHHKYAVYQLNDRQINETSSVDNSIKYPLPNNSRPPTEFNKDTKPYYTKSF